MSFFFNVQLYEFFVCLVLISYWIYCLQISSYSIECAFLLLLLFFKILLYFPSLCKSFSPWNFPICLFFLLFHWEGKHIAKTDVKELLLLSSRSFMASCLMFKSFCFEFVIYSWCESNQFDSFACTIQFPNSIY